MDALRARFHPERGSSNRHTIMVVGLNYEQGQTQGDTAYQQNVKFIHSYLERRGDNIAVLAATYNYSSRERQMLMEIARISGNVGSDEVSLMDDLRRSTSVFSLHVDRLINVPDITATFYPKDWFVVGKHATATDPTLVDIPALDTSISTHIRRADISEGGRYVVNSEVVFAGFVGDSESQNRDDITRLLYPDRRVIFLPTPEQIGIVDRTRVTGHIDQFIGKALPSKDGTILYVPIDANYYAALQNAPEGLANFDAQAGNKSIQFVPISPDILHRWHLLNNVGTDDVTFIGPMLRDQLSQLGIWKNIHQQRVVVLPAEIAATNSPEGGLACKLVLTNADREVQQALLTKSGRR